jgi:hypothetical protein
MEYVGKLIRVRNQYFITVPVDVYREWRKLLIEEVNIVNVRYDENTDVIYVYPHQLKMHGELRKLIQRGSTYLLTVPQDIGNKWYSSGAVFVRKVFSEKDMCLAVKPVRGEVNDKKVS